MKKFRKNKGFTLIELLMVISIIGLLSGVLLKGVNESRVKARNTLRIQNAETIAKGFQIAITGANGNQFPRSFAGGSRLVCLGKSPCSVGDTSQGYYGYVEDTAVSAVLRSGIAGGKIPLDPLWTDGLIGYDAFLYSSWDSPDSEHAYGTYIQWMMEERGNKTCGRGFEVETGFSGPYACALYLGPPTQ